MSPPACHSEPARNPVEHSWGCSAKLCMTEMSVQRVRDAILRVSAAMLLCDLRNYSALPRCLPAAGRCQPLPKERWWYFQEEGGFMCCLC